MENKSCFGGTLTSLDCLLCGAEQEAVPVPAVVTHQKWWDRSVFDHTLYVSVWMLLWRGGGQGREVYRGTHNKGVLTTADWTTGWPVVHEGLTEVFPSRSGRSNHRVSGRV